MTAQTPLYGIKYLVQGEPARNTRQALEDNAKTIEAALASKALVPPTASDYATIQGRVGTLWADRKVAPLAPTSTAFTWNAANWGQWDPSAPGYEIVRVSRNAQGLVSIRGLGKNLTAVAANAIVPVLTLQAPYRPRSTALSKMYAAGTTACRVDVTPAGLVNLYSVAAYGAAGFWEFAIDFYSADSTVSLTQ